MSLNLTGEEVTKLFHDAFDPVWAEWEKKLERQAELALALDGEVTQLRARVYRLESLLERMGKIALQERA